MAETPWQTRSLHVLVITSLCTIFLLWTITFLTPHTQDGFAWRRLPTGSLFSLLCILGIIAVFFPQHCTRSAYKYQNSHPEALLQQQQFQTSSALGGVTVTHGHHPLCERYRQHEFLLGEKTLCSACMGLFSGALIALVGACYVFLLQGPFNLPYGLAAAFGAIAIMLGLVSHVVSDTQGPARRFFFNALMIVGMLFLLTGADGIAQSLAVNALLIGSFILVLFTRILVSQDRHDQICKTCEQACAE